MKNFAMAKEQFRKMRCGHCQAHFEPEGIKLLREEKDYWVVRVTCLGCGQPAGVAIVGVEYDGPGDAPRVKAPKAPPRDEMVFTNKKEIEKFEALAPISSNDVIDAHHFFRNLGDDWMRHFAR